MKNDSRPQFLSSLPGRRRSTARVNRTHLIVVAVQEDGFLAPLIVDDVGDRRRRTAELPADNRKQRVKAVPVIHRSQFLRDPHTVVTLDGAPIRFPDNLDEEVKVIVLDPLPTRH